MREPSLLPVFRKLGAKGPRAVAIESVPPTGIAPRLREALAAHGGMVLKPVVVRRRAMVGMSPRDANAMVDQMNVRDVKRREKAERKS
ncbi:hypothetical protein LB566_09740 [Mesorhizobium sp. CA13]|uniref:hypothetical protein n=1 Tax=Mesorhizobium sp. CA13 TaxID=2876643 RepID=UPI001CCF23A7|nr:hypothetical protein [Mesorhizobium sp. CA13]MBZ9854083.1 hypothetical protein [Mesorhizobium sp. CA13]